MTWTESLRYAREQYRMLRAERHLHKAMHLAPDTPEGRLLMAHLHGYGEAVLSSEGMQDLRQRRETVEQRKPGLQNDQLSLEVNAQGWAE